MKQQKLKREKLIMWKSAIIAICISIVFALSLRAESISSPEKKRLLTPIEFKQKLNGPILSIPTPFTETNEIDYRGINKIIKRALDHDCKVVALTSGNGKYDRLSYTEIKELTRCVVEAVSDKGVTIVASGDWDKGKILDYVRYAESVGASAVQVMRPKGFDPNNDSEAVKFYQEVADNTRLGIVLHGKYSEELLRKLVEINSIIALKEDVDLTYYITRQIVFGDRLAIFGGGDESRYLHGCPYGSPAYYSIFYTFAPEIGLKFWTAIKSKDMKTAAEIVEKYDLPFMEHFSHPFWSASIEYFGGAQRYMRPRQETLNGEEIEKMRELFCEMGLKPETKYCCSVTKGIPLLQEWARGGHIGGIVDGSIIVAGGNNWSKDKKTKYWLKDSAVFRNGKWIAGPALPKPVAYAMFANDDSGLYVAGGTDDGTSVSSEVYRLTALKEDQGWKPLPQLPTAASSGAGAILNGKFYVACGSLGKTKSSKMWVLDIKNPGGNWHPCQSIPGVERIFPSLVACGKYLYLIGGLAETSTPLKDAYRYDPDLDQWVKLGDLPLKGYCWVSQPIDEGHLIITGRADDSKTGIYKDIWIIDLSDMSMERVGDLICATTTTPLINTASKQWWLVGGEPDSNLNRTEKVSVITLK